MGVHWTRPDAAQNPLALRAQRPGGPAPASTARPLVGLYDSADPTIARRHVQLAKATGIDAFLVSWWDKHNGVVYWIVDKIEHDSRAAHSGDTAREKRIPVQWLATPGIASFGFYSTFSNFRAHRYEELAGKYRYLTRLAHDAGKKMLLPVHPGHDNSHFREATHVYVMPRRDGQTLRDFLRAASDAGADHILITSWNEWPETTVIEPSCSWANPYFYLEVVAEWRGVEFIVPPLPPAATPARQ